MRTVEAEVDGGLHPLVVEERLQLLAGRRGLLPRLHQPAPSVIDSSDQQQKPAPAEKKTGPNPASGLGWRGWGPREATYRRHRARRPGDSSGFGGIWCGGKAR